MSDIHAQEQWGWQSIDTAYIVCQYQYSRPGTLVSRKVEDMRLEIGKRISKFFSQTTFEYDSLRTTPEGRIIISRKSEEQLRKTTGRTPEEQIVILNEIPSRETECVVYKNYPQGNMYIQDAGGYTPYEYNDDFVPQQWSIQTDTMIYLGYHCQKATCSWRGRDYIAWFTSEIPVSDGPMKFYGLPGLIVEVADTEKNYIFELKGIEQRNKPIYLNKPNSSDYTTYEPITRKELQQKQIKYFKSVVREFQRSMAQLGKSSNLLKEDAFDLLERDYK